MSATETNFVVVDKPLFKTDCILGEGPIFDDETGILHFVDIVKKQVLHFHTRSEDLVVDQYDEAVSCLAFRRDRKGLACAAERGFATIDPESHKLEYLSRPLPPDLVGHVRFNDGGCSSSGVFFSGTICSTEPAIPGQLFRFDPDKAAAAETGEGGGATLVDPGPFTDCNGLGWSADEKTLYLTDSLVNRIWAYDYDIATGELANKRLFVDTLALGLPEGTYPDGLCFDSDGGLWSARWGGCKIVRHSTREGDSGAIDFEIRFPTALNVTACCFGGPRGDQMYVTTAHCSAVGGDASRQSLYPDSGSIFQVDLSGRFQGGKWRYNFGL